MNKPILHSGSAAVPFYLASFCRILALMLICLCFGAAGAQATTYYVSPSGSDTNPGSQAAPFLTLQHAANLVQAGDSVLVEAGNYAGFILGWNAPTAGTATAPITFTADPTAPTGSVVINHQNNETHVGIDLEPGCNYIYVNGFVLDGSTGAIASYPNHGSGIKMTGNYDQVTNCTVHDIGYGQGIFCDSAVGILIQGNTIYNTGDGGNADYGHGIYVSGNSTGAIVRGNLIHDNAYIGIHVNGDIGSSGAPGLVQHALIEDNIVYNNGQNALNCDGLQSSIIRNNLFYNYQNFGICLYQIDAGGPSSNNLIVNNTIVSSYSGAGAALRILNAGTGNTVLNTMLLGADGNAYRISSDSLSGLTSNYNVMSGSVQSDDTGSEETLAQWQSQTHQDLNSFMASASALFVNAAGNNYQLSSSSPAIDAGTATDAPSTDILGTARPQGQGFDIGCYEYVGSQTVALSSLAVSPTSVAGGSSAQGTVTLTSAAPSGGITVTLSSNSSAASVPASVTVAAGTTSVTFTVTTTSVTSNTTVTLTASYNGVSKTATLTVQAPTTVGLSSLTVSPTSVVGGNSAQGKVTLTSAAPSGGITVTLSSNSSAASVPASVTVAAGTTSVTFTVTTTSVTSNTTVTLTASYNGVSKTATLTVQPAASSNFVLGVCLGGPQGVTIDGNQWQSYSQALSNGLSVSNAQAAQTSTTTFIPTPDAATAQMLSWCIWTHATSNGVGFTLKQTLPNGNYQVYLWEVEDGQDYARTMNVILNGVTAATGVGNQQLGHWTKYGPYSATVSAGVLKIRVVRDTMGNPQMMGLAIFKQ